MARRKKSTRTRMVKKRMRRMTSKVVVVRKTKKRLRRRPPHVARLELGLPPHGTKRSITGTDNAKAEDDGTKFVFTKLANAKMLVMR